MSVPANVLLFPIRHHSPACAWHIERLIKEQRPSAVLIEGPSDATTLIPHIVHPDTRAPIVIYTTFVDTHNALNHPNHDRANPARFSAYYPLADFSPELVALRTAHDIGAAARFIGLPFPQMVLAEGGPPQPDVRSLLDERYFQHSRFLQALCDRTGARDPDDLWDHLYEHGYRDLTTEEFVQRVATYCSLSRQDHTPEMLAAEGHVAREAAMAAAIRAEATQNSGLILAITGGFHTAGLAALIEQNAIAQPIAVPNGEAQTLLMRYGFAQLDRLNGYASGMPAPAFYQRVWDHLHENSAHEARQRAAAELIVELGRISRERGPGLSPADEIAALDHTRRLAAFRGHAEPTREDMLDGMRSAFVKGAITTDGVMLLAQARKLLAGDRIGDLCADVGVAPLVADFRRTAADLRLDLDMLELHEITLDLYRKRTHRAISRFFYRLQFLEVPFATFRQGPDFVAGKNLERVQEVWRYSWTPATETVLTERTLYGGTSREACAAKLQAALYENQRHAGLMATQLLHACRMGLHEIAPRLLDRTSALVAEDAELGSLVRAAEQLLILQRSRESLEAHDLPDINTAAALAYDRACYLLPELAGTAPEAERQVISALNALQQVALILGDTPQRQNLRQAGLRAVLEAGDGNAALRGACAGLLFVDGALTEHNFVQTVVGQLDLHGPAFVLGLLQTNRACVWQVRSLTAALNDWLCAGDQTTFVQRLPELRLAFADLTAREADYVARTIAELVGARQVPPLLIANAGPDDLLLGAALNARLAAALERDGLAAFVEAQS